MKKFRFSNFLLFFLICIMSHSQNFLGIEDSFLMYSKFHLQDFRPISTDKLVFYYGSQATDQKLVLLDPDQFAQRDYKTLEFSTRFFYQIGLGKKKRKNISPFFAKPTIGYTYTNLVIREPNDIRTSDGHMVSSGVIGKNYIEHKLQSFNTGLNIGYYIIRKKRFVMSAEIGMEKRILFREKTTEGDDFGSSAFALQPIYNKLPITYGIRLEGSYFQSKAREKTVKLISLFIELLMINDRIQDDTYWKNVYGSLENGSFFQPEGAEVRIDNSMQFFTNLGLGFSIGNKK